MSRNLQAQTSEKIAFLALGDSYTIGESVSPSERWPVVLVERLRQKGMECEDARIIATTGWRTDQLKAAMQAAAIKPGDYNLISLLIGVNNQYQGKSAASYLVEFEELLREAIRLAGSKDRVFVLSIPDYGYTPFGKGNQEKISQELDAFNKINSTISAKYGVRYYSITEISRRGLAKPPLVAGDGLHPSGLMYKEWVDLLFKDPTFPF